MSEPAPTSYTATTDRADAAFAELGDADIDISAEPQEPEEDLFGLSEDAPPDEGEEGAEEPEEADAPPKVAPPSKLGSKDKPYTVKNLPESFVTLKIDGEEKTVPLREMTEGYMRETAFYGRMSQAADLTKRAKEAGEALKAESERFRSSFQELLSNPDELFSFLDDHAQETLDLVARKHFQRVIAWQKDPQARMAHEYEKRQRALEKQRQKLEAERGEYQRTRQEQEAHAKYVSAFKPGYEAGMKRAGYPKVTDEFRDTVKGLLSARRSSAGEVTAKDVEEAVVRAARAVGAETVAQRRPAPSPAATLPGKPKSPQAQRAKPAQNKSFSQIFRDLGK